MYVDFFPKENQNILALLITIWLCLNKMAFKKQKILRREDRDQTNCLLIAWLRYEKGLSNPHTRSFKSGSIERIFLSFPLWYPDFRKARSLSSCKGLLLSLNLSNNLVTEWCKSSQECFSVPKAELLCCVGTHCIIFPKTNSWDYLKAMNIWRQIFRYRQYTSQSTTFWGPIVGQQSFPIPSFSPFVDKDKGQNLNKKTLKKSWRSRATRIEVQYNKVWFTSFVMGIEKRGISWSANKAAFG